MTKMSEVNCARERRGATSPMNVLTIAQVGADAEARDDARDDEVRVVGGERVVERADAGQRHRHHQHVAAAVAVGERAQDERADDVAREVQDDGELQRIEGRLGRAPGLEGDAALDERHVDVEDVVRR
jgi:hypothetical protein